MSNNLAVPENITIPPLPPKSPELNPVANTWQFMRDNWLSNRVFKSDEDIVDHCCYVWRLLRPQITPPSDARVRPILKDRTMKRSKFTEEQIISILREQEAGAKTAELCRKHGMSEATFYAWKAKFGGMEVSDAKRLKVLEEENAKLKRLLAEAMLDQAALKDLLSRKW